MSMYGKEYKFDTVNWMEVAKANGITDFTVEDAEAMYAIAREEVSFGNPTKEWDRKTKRFTAYDDGRGIATIGVGHRIKKGEEGEGGASGAPLGEDAGDNPEALKEKTEFSAEEWAAFGITALRLDHCIKSGNSYFRPFTGMYKSVCKDCSYERVTNNHQFQEEDEDKDDEAALE